MSEHNEHAQPSKLKQGERQLCGKIIGEYFPPRRCTRNKGHQDGCHPLPDSAPAVPASPQPLEQACDKSGSSWWLRGVPGWKVTAAAPAVSVSPAPAAPPERDDCQLCRGRQGGVPGNENIKDGVIVCDYCSATLLGFERLRASPAPAAPAPMMIDPNLCAAHGVLISSCRADKRDGCFIAARTLTTAQRQELYTLMGQWSHNTDLQFEQVAKWINETILN